MFRKKLNTQDKDVCIGPLIKYTVFDAFFGALCGILLIVGSLQKSLVRTSTLLFNEHCIPQLQTIWKRLKQPNLDLPVSSGDLDGPDLGYQRQIYPRRPHTWLVVFGGEVKISDLLKLTSVKTTYMYL